MKDILKDYQRIRPEICKFQKEIAIIEALDNG
jgi:hypothetical protein